MSKVRGTIEQISEKTGASQHGEYTQVGIKINGNWHNGFKKKDWDTYKEGDEVVLDIEENEKNGKTYKNIVGLTNLSEGSTEGKKQTGIPDFQPANTLPQEPKKEVDWDGKERRIVRENALTQANELLTLRYGIAMHKGTIVSVPTQEDLKKELFQIAEECEKWVYRGPDTQKQSTQAQPEKKEEPIEGFVDAPNKKERRK